MYPRNSAAPPRIAIGAVIQVSDGAMQTSGVSVAVRPNGGAEASGLGTVAYGALSSVVYYTPTQAETDYTDFAVVAYKAGCSSVPVTIVTTAESTAGTVRVGSIAAAAIASIWGALTSALTAVGSIGKWLVDRLPNANPGTEGGLPVLSADLTVLAELDTAALALINKIEASTAGTVSGAGTDTEIFVGSNVTLTITVDADGNRSAVVVS